MKILNFLGSIFIPSKMYKRKDMFIIFPILILLIASFVIAIPYMKTFEKYAYETYCEASLYNFRVLDSESSEEAEWTDEDKTILGAEYEYVTVSDLKNIEFKVDGGTVVLPDNVKALKDLPYNGKKYLLKRNVFHFDEEGTKTDDVDTYYVHIVFDIFDKLGESKYNIKDEFDKKMGDYNHFLFVFLYDGFQYRNEYMVDNNQASFGFEYTSQKIDFSEIEELDYISKKITDLLIPKTKTQYTYTSFIYATLIPFVVIIIAFFITKSKNVLVSFKNYFNIGGLCSIPVMILFFALEWNETLIRLGIMEMYWLIFAVYYFLVISIVNKTYYRG